MKSRKGFTLIELMVVVLIVAVLAAVLIPLLTARLESARWSEGKAGVGTIATAIRAMYAEQGDAFAPSDTVSDYCNPEDLYGKYFSIDCYQLTGVTIVEDPGPTDYPVLYTITVLAPDNVDGAPNGEQGGATGPTWKVASWSLDEEGIWTREMKTTGP
jgi:prepilin-type N-terminal cleavage/methylation domain-containing protein